jgi:hypothetical protein
MTGFSTGPSHQTASVRVLDSATYLPAPRGLSSYGRVSPR